METLLVERLAATYWRLRRLYRFEVQTIVDARYETGQTPPDAPYLPVGYNFERLMRYEAQIDRTLHRLTTQLARLRALRPNEESQPAPESSTANPSEAGPAPAKPDSPSLSPRPRVAASPRQFFGPAFRPPVCPVQ